ncbi:MAG TPA: hypothetical protein VI837_05615 [Blastocatellia bacterium]|nr:hypothetical protein [Blastocatellia bacterium]
MQGDIDLSTIAQTMAVQGFTQLARATFQSARQIAEAQPASSGPVQQDQLALSHVAKQQAAAGFYADAMETAEKLRQGSLYRGEAELEVVKSQAADGKVAEALLTARRILKEECRVKAYCEIAKAQLKTGDIDGARQIVAEVREYATQPEQHHQDQGDHAQQLAEVALVQFHTRDPEGAQGSLSRALEAVSTLGSRYQINRRKPFIASAYATIGDYQRALDVANSMDDNRDIALQQIALEYVRAGRGADAVRTADLMGTGSRFWLLPDVASELLTANDLVSFKRVLISCANDLGSAHRVCALLARAYPTQAAAVSVVLRREAQVE